MRVICLAILLALFIEFSPMLAYGSENFEAYMHRIARELHLHNKNLNQMVHGTRSAEHTAVMEIISETQTTTESTFALWHLLNIRRQMIDATDRATVDEELGDYIAETIESVDTDIMAVNAGLPELSSPAIVSEGGKLRDALIDLKTKLKAQPHAKMKGQ